MNSITPISKQHVPALDGVRGLAIALVFIHHVGIFFPQYPWLLVFINHGWIGVDLFFVLSGYLITGILLDTKERPDYFRSFYFRRVLRIFPLYYAVLVITLGALYLLHANPEFFPQIGERPFYFLYLQNWLPGRDANAFHHFWSLAIEEQFYLVWPWVIWKLSPKSLVRFAAFGMIGAFCLRILCINLPANLVFFITPTRIDPMLAGALASLAMRGHVRIPSQNRLFYVSLLSICGFLFITPYRAISATLGFSLLALGFAALLLQTVAYRDSHIFEAHILRILGRYSYGLYIFHYPILAFAIGYNATIIRALVATVIIGCLTWASYEFYEKRFLRLKNLDYPGLFQLVPDIRKSFLGLSIGRGPIPEREDH